MLRLLLALVLAAPAAADPPSFLNEVVPVLTRAGCNQGACHGKAVGQNGFRLSLRGYAPDQDHAAITHEFGGRRIDAAVPENSLLLRKPLGDAPHQGGRLFTRDGPEYRTLLAWLRGGMPGPNPNDPKLVSLSLRPGPLTAKVGDSFALTAEAQFSNGSRRDVTWLTKFDANDPALVEVTSDGHVTALRNGETAIRASFQSEVAVLVLTVPFSTPVPPERFAARNNAVDDAVFHKLAVLRIEPSDLCGDEAFVRRTFLDTIGVLPTPEEVQAFVTDSRRDKRARLIDALLERPEFVDFWTLQLCDLFQNRRERDHDVRGVKGVRTFHEWVRRQVAANRPWDQIARDVLTATGKSSANPAVGYYVVTVGEQREAHRSEVVASVAQAFLGTRIGCAQCHNHPLERYTQDDYYHFAGFFSRIRFERKEPKDGPTTLTVSHPDPNQNRTPVGVLQPRTGWFLKPQPLDRSAMEVSPNEDPRAKLAAWVTDPMNEAFAGAMVNRLWRHFLGVGLVEPVDDLRATNPPSNPEVWALLTREFVAAKFDLRHVMRLILNSRTYQLDSATKPGNATDSRFYSHYYARRLPAEVLLDAMSQATGVPDQFPGYPLGVRAVQVPDPGLKSYFLSLFGRSERVTACACERSGDVTMPQLLHLQNGEAVVQKIRSGDGRLARLLKAKKSNDETTDELFLAALARKPTAPERSEVARLLADDPDRDSVFRDLFWALLNSKDFAFNH